MNALHVCSFIRSLGLKRGSATLLLWVGWMTTQSLSGASVEGLRHALSFHASFDQGPDADFGAGDRRIYHLKSLNHPRIGSLGLPAEGSITLVRGAGRFGDALSFQPSNTHTVFFQAEKNLRYSQTNWSGTVSFWLKLTPETDLAPGFCDPFQITSRQWNDAALWVDFSKDDRPRHFRFGAFADREVWDPSHRDLDAMPLANRPLVTVTHPPFARDRWTHVVFTFERFNTGVNQGIATLYLDGKQMGIVSPRLQTFSWDPAKTIAMLGIAYTGLLDDVAFFHRALSAGEVEQLHGLPSGVASLHR